MKSEEGFEGLIRQMDSADLLVLWEKIIQRAELPEWPKGRALEYLVIRAFELGGATVTYPFEVRQNGHLLEQIDGAVYYQNISCLIECKDYSTERIDFTPLSKMRSQLLRRPSGTIGCMFSVSGFTLPAIILASNLAPQTILLWEGNEIGTHIANKSICNALLAKYRHFVEHCVPDYDTLEIR